MEKKIQSVCVYCGSGDNVDRVYKDAATELGRLLAASGITLVYGGEVTGLLGALSNACIGQGGKVVGIILDTILREKGGQAQAAETVVVDSLHTRKKMMEERADAFLVLPGGIGTLDEMFSMLANKYIGAHQKRIILLNTNAYFTPLLEMVDHMIRQGFSPSHHRHLFEVVDHPHDILRSLAIPKE